MMKKITFISLATSLGAAVIFITLHSSPTSELVFIKTDQQDSSHLNSLSAEHLNTQDERDNLVREFGFDPEIVAEQENANREANTISAQAFAPRTVEEMFPAINNLINSDISDTYNEASRAAIIAKFMQDIDPKIDEINQSLQAMNKISFPEKETYIKIATQRIEHLETLKASIQ